LIENSVTLTSCLTVKTVKRIKGLMISHLRDLQQFPYYWVDICDKVNKLDLM